MLCTDFRRLVAVALVLTTTLITLPVSAADFSTARPVIGSVSAVGSVDLRGLGISQEGTLFAGDSIHSHEKGYAKVLLRTGSKLELSEKTEVTVNRDEHGERIGMNTGTIGFTAKSPLRVNVIPFEITASDDASGNVVVMSSTTAGVRVINGKVTVHNLATSESFVLTKGQEQLFGLQNGVHAQPLARVASNMPLPVPAPGTRTPGAPAPGAPVPGAPVPQTPAGKTSTSGLALDTGAWLAIIGGGAVTGVAIWALVDARNNNDDVDSLKTRLTAVTNLSTVSSSVAQQTATLATASALASQAQLALVAAGNPAGAGQFQSLQSQITANQNQLNALQNQIQAAQVQASAGASGAQAQLAALLAQEETLRNQTNSLLGQMTNLLNTFKNTTGVPNPGNVPGAVGGPPVASASNPV